MIATQPHRNQEKKKEEETHWLHTIVSIDFHTNTSPPCDNKRSELNLLKDGVREKNEEKEAEKNSKMKQEFYEKRATVTYTY